GRGRRRRGGRRDGAEAPADEAAAPTLAAGEEDGADAEDTDDDAPRERAERVEGESGRGRGRRRRGGRRDGAEAPADEAAAPTLAAGEEDDDDSESGRRRRRGRRGGRRVREEGGERDGFNWVRGRTPSLEDPYVWFDPINPERTEARTDASVAETPVGDVDEVVGERPEGEIGGERTGRSRRRRGRGRGRDRGGDQGLTHEVKVETRATNEGMPADGSPDTPMAVFVEDAADAAPAPIAEEPKRRRVRRKVSASATADSATDPVSSVEPNEAEPAGEPAVLDVTPVEAAAQETVIPAPEPEPEPAPVVAPVAAPVPEIDVAALIADDPNQISAPPEKPKRGWWRR
ncbi:MAG: ribonuclease E/G, partial [Brevundimonas sp.]